MIYKTIIFDFDGTIADTLEEGRRIFNIVAPDYGVRQIAPGEVMALRKLTITELIEHFEIPKMRVPVFIARGTAMMRKSIDRLPLIPGMGEVLKEIRPKVDRFGILTSNAAENVDVFLKSHGIRDLFDFISSTSKLTGKSRYLSSIRKEYGLKAEEMLYVGDEVRDLKAAKKAGVPCAAVSWGFNAREVLIEEHPDLLFDRPVEFLQLAGN